MGTELWPVLAELAGCVRFLPPRSRNQLYNRRKDSPKEPQTGQRCEALFRDAVARELLSRNPFAGLKGTVGSNRQRDFFIDRLTAAKALEACPDSEWRLLFALSRYGGLRCPSEHLALTWADVNWSEAQRLIRNLKTEHHEGKESRTIPIFPELRPYLEFAWDCAAPGAIYVIQRYRSANANLRTQPVRILEKAGVTPWPKLFQNLRAELASEHPAHVAAAWLGHSTLVAN